MSANTPARVRGRPRGRGGQSAPNNPPSSPHDDENHDQGEQQTPILGGNEPSENVSSESTGRTVEGNRESKTASGETPQTHTTTQTTPTPSPVSLPSTFVSSTRLITKRAL